jgi:hypothetical protein
MHLQKRDDTLGALLLTAVAVVFLWGTLQLMVHRLVG